MIRKKEIINLMLLELREAKEISQTDVRDIMDLISERIQKNTNVKLEDSIINEARNTVFSGVNLE